mgnify:CR=1 FL=1
MLYAFLFVISFFVLQIYIPLYILVPIYLIIYYIVTHEELVKRYIYCIKNYKPKKDVIKYIEENLTDLLKLHWFSNELFKKDENFDNFINKNNINFDNITFAEKFFYYYDIVYNQFLIDNDYKIKYVNFLWKQEYYNLITNEIDANWLVQHIAIWWSPYWVFSDWKWELDDIGWWFHMALKNKNLDFSLKMKNTIDYNDDTMELLINGKYINVKRDLKYSELFGIDENNNFDILLNIINSHLEKENVIIVELISWNDDYSFFVYDLDKYNILKNNYPEELKYIIGK